MGDGRGSIGEEVREMIDTTTLGRIKITKTSHRVGDSFVDSVHSVEWEGPPLAMVSCHLLRAIDQPNYDIGEYVELGPLVVKVVGRDVVSDSVIVENIDSVYGAFYEARFRLLQWWQWLSPRIVYTLAIWGLANYPRPGDTVGWYLVKERWA